MIRRTRFAAAVGVLALAAAGCGSSSKSSSSATSSAAATTSSAAATTSSAAATTSAASSSAAPSASANSIKGDINVLAIGDTSGPTKIYGELHYAGLLAAVAYYNAKGGIDGHKIVVKHLDSGGVAANSVSLAVKELSANPTKYAMVDAGVEGTEDEALIPIMKKYGVFAITLDDAGTCAKAANCPNEFVIKGDPADPQKAAAAFFKSKGVKKVGVLEEAIAFTEGETPGIVAALKANGITPDVVQFPATATDLTSEMSELKGKGVTGVFAEALGPPAGYALQARSKLGWNVPLTFDVAASSIDVTKLAPVALDKNAYLNVYNCQNGAKPNVGLAALLKNMPASYKATASGQACDITGNGWDEIVELDHAITQAGSTAVSALDKAMVNLTPAAQNDPLYVTSKSKMYSTTDHQDLAEKPSDFTVIPVGPVNNSQDQPPAK